MSKVTVLTDDQIKEAADMADYSQMVTADDYIYVIARTIEAAMLESEEVKGWKKDAERLKSLIALCGYVENGSDTAVALFQDDATREWVVRIGSNLNGNFFTGPSAKQAIDAAKESNHD